MTISLDRAQQLLGDVGYEVRVDCGVLIATRTVGDDCLSLTLAESHVSQVVSHWINEPGRTAAARFETGIVRGGVFRPYSFTRAVRRGVVLALRLDIDHRAAQAPAIIGDQLAAALDQAHADEPVQDASAPVSADATTDSAVST